MRYVIAVGGNAIHGGRALDSAARSIAKLYSKGNQVIVTHGNGPQVGSLAAKEDEELAILTAQTEAWIGIELQMKIAEELARISKKYDYSIPTVVLTAVVVESDGAGLRNPSKPIGRFYTKKEAHALSHHGITFRKLIGGYRRVVPSPMPKEIVQKRLIENLLKEGKIVIACGGGGIPLIKQKGRLQYVDAVLDKDRSSALLAKEVHADKLFILTAVDGAYLDYGGKNQKLIGRIRVGELSKYMKQGAFEEGSMKPKVEACIDFVKSTGRSAGIGNLSKAEDVISLKRLTLITA